MIKASLRGLLQRKLRLALAMFAIVLSVGFLAGSLVLTNTLNARFAALFSTISESTDVQVQAKQTNGEPPLMSQADIDKLAKVEGAKAVSGDVSSEGLVPFKKSTGKAIQLQAPSLGVGTRGDDSSGFIEVRDGRYPTAAGEVAVSGNTAKLAEVGVGDDLKVFIPLTQAPQTFKVVGVVVYSGGRESLGGESLILFQETEAQQLFYGKTGVYAGASITAADGVSHDELKKRVEAVLPNGFQAQTAEEWAKAQSDAVSSAFSTLGNIIFTPFAVIAALVGLFLIYNTFNIVVAQRTRELALLRALGAGWGQVIWAVLLEALVVGGIGSTLGLLAGIGLGAGGEKLLSSAVGLELPSGGLVISFWTVFWAYALGVVVTMIAAFVPAIKAALVPPIAAMREAIKPDKSLVGLSITGGIMVAVGGGLMALGLIATGSWTIWPLLGGVLLVVFGAAMLSPLLSKLVVGFLGKAFGWSQAGKLGVRNALRNPRRTAVTAVALMIGVTVISTLGVIAQSAKDTVRNVISSDLGAEVIVQAGQGAEPGKTGFDPKVMEKVRALPEVEKAAAWSFGQATVAGTPSFVFITDVKLASEMFDMKPASGEIRTLNTGELVTDDRTAKANNWKVGDSLVIELPKGERTFRVVGIYQATDLLQGTILGESAQADMAGPLAGIGYVDLKDGADVGQGVKDVEKLMDDYPLVTVSDQSSYIKQSTQIFDFLITAITILLGLALFIALLGILNTLLLSIVERTRELGLVRAIGLGRGGVMGMIGVESILIAVFGCVLGIALGVGMGSAIVTSLIASKQLTVLTLPWGSLVTYLVAAVVAGVVAALWPAWRASRLNVLDAIAYE